MMMMIIVHCSFKKITQSEQNCKECTYYDKITPIDVSKGRLVLVDDARTEQTLHFPFLF